MRLRICPASDDIIAYQAGHEPRRERSEPAGSFGFTLPDGSDLIVAVEYAPSGERGWTLDVHLPDGSKLDGISWWSDGDDDAR